MKRSLRDIASWIFLLLGAAVWLAAAIAESPRSRIATAALAVVVLAVLAITVLDRDQRRRRRMRQGHCPRCDYDLRYRIGHGCPECGWRRRGISAGGA